VEYYSSRKKIFTANIKIIYNFLCVLSIILKPTLILYC